MTAQIMDTTISLRTDIVGGEAGIGLYRENPAHTLLHIVAVDGSGRVDFVHHGDDREQSARFLRTLAEHALRMARELADD
ncbi:MAG TPA: hypothetical protein VF444_01535 [Pseudonocardiaceae bacterium]